ncbi:hypothetical protein CAP35_09350 [Chitinophagaceae bacterium IBVUCB1]|nr:hypothetical protein CAP35_09350 [Chitinophagaceae bacterium IBVUCB1]
MSCAQPTLDCESITSKEIDKDYNDMVKKIKVCGEFSGDDTLLLQGSILGSQIVSLTNEKALTYKDLISKLNEIRHSENYPLIIQALKAERNSTTKPVEAKPTSISFSKLSNLELAIKEATDSDKPLFIYFTSKYCMSSRHMEKGLLADNDVIGILDKYVRYIANVDDATIQKLQIEKFRSNSQPYFVILVNGKNIADFTGLTDNKDEFMDFLKKGL